MVETNTKLSFESYSLLDKHQKLLAQIYKTQVLGHVYLEQFEAYNKLEPQFKLLVKNELRLFYVKKQEYIHALRLIEKKTDMSTVLSLTGLSEKTYYKLLNNPIVLNYVYGAKIKIKHHNAYQKHLVEFDNLADIPLYDISQIDIENFYYAEKSTHEY